MPRTARLNLEVMEDQCLQYIEESGARLDMEQSGVHYLLTSGYHSPVFFNMPRAFERYVVRNYLAHFFLRKIKQGDMDPRSIDVLIGPATGALPLLYALQSFPDFEHARVLFVERVPLVVSLNKKINRLTELENLLEKDDGTSRQTMEKELQVVREEKNNLEAKVNDKRGKKDDFVLGRGFELCENDNVFIVDDVGTTFGSIRAVHGILEKTSCVVVGAGVLVDRSPDEKEKKHLKNQAFGMKFICGIRVPQVYFEEDCPHCKNGVKVVRV